MCKELCSKIKENPYTLRIFENAFFNLVLLQEKDNILIFEKRFDDSAGYVFLVCEREVNLKLFRKIYKSYAKFVKENVKGIFKEVELIIVAKHVNSETKRIIEDYNSIYTERKPIIYQEIER